MKVFLLLFFTLQFYFTVFYILLFITNEEYKDSWKRTKRTYIIFYVFATFGIIIISILLTKQILIFNFLSK